MFHPAPHVLDVAQEMLHINLLSCHAALVFLPVVEEADDLWQRDKLWNLQVLLPQQGSSGTDASEVPQDSGSPLLEHMDK